MGAHKWIVEERQVAALWALLLTLVLVGGVLELLAPPGGWLFFELPALFEPPVLDRTARDAALLGIGLDFLFLAQYPLFLSLLLGRAGTHWNLGPRLSRACAQGAALALTCGPLDVAENVGLFFLLVESSDESLAVAVTVFAGLKWALLLLAVLPLAIVCVWCRLLRIASAPSAANAWPTP